MKGNIIQYNFLRMDNEDFYDLDYAIVLEDKGDKLTILPFNNKFAKDSISSFCLGKIDGFIEIRNEGFIENSGQYVYFEKMIDVNKSDVNLVYKQDLDGNLIKNENGDFIPVTLSDSQNEMISIRYELYEEGEAKTPLGVIFKADKSFKLDYNSISSKELLELGNTRFDRYREFNFGDEKVLLFFIDGKRYSIIMRKGHTFTREERNSALAVHFNIA